ncbi:hypothetical protein H0264_14630 [Nocardia huaxiensis]|uniref:Uncharacterized protein n=1 Tax=Nocardia huaxiensis TaxID=2755382 RepID=A0A7D6ZR63_9NOCA|nr:hypothetical protein [Nocardia huaxiensis]QLY33303.1 hypothetical protein H0264_14630 [Nocardia huaxiensis]
MDADLLLTWMSEMGSGDIRDLRQRVAWMARTADRSPKPYETAQWLRDVSALGHAEIDWQGGTWAVAPAVAALLPATGGTAVLAGSRRIGLVERLEELAAVNIEHPARSNDGPLPVPASVFVQADSVEELCVLLAEAGVEYVGYAARTIARGLRPIARGRPAGPPAEGDKVKHFSSNRDEIRVRPGLFMSDGLYELQVHGRPSYRYRANGSWYHTDYATGTLLDCADRGINVFRWRPERVAESEEIGTAFIDRSATLPPLQARVLVLCSGLATQYGDRARTAIYRNVPKDIALLVAESVHQPVSILS